MIGISVSASFLLILAIINSVILHRILKSRRELRRQAQAGTYAPRESTPAFGCIGRAVRPLLKLIDAPWKLYPIGILFGMGFDTASEISLLGISALAQNSGSSSIAASEIIILPALFTAGMSLVDSVGIAYPCVDAACPNPICLD